MTWSALLGKRAPGYGHLVRLTAPKLVVPFPMPAEHEVHPAIDWHDRYLLSKQRRHRVVAFGAVQLISIGHGSRREPRCLT